MKKFFGGIFGSVALFGAICFCRGYECHYSRTAEVINCNHETITVIDSVGYEWAFTVNNDDTLTTGDKVKLIMNTNGTDANIFDDIIENYKIIK